MSASLWVVCVMRAGALWSLGLCNWTDLTVPSEIGSSLRIKKPRLEGGLSCWVLLEAEASTVGAAVVKPCLTHAGCFHLSWLCVWAGLCSEEVLDNFL